MRRRVAMAAVGLTAALGTVLAPGLPAQAAEIPVISISQERLRTADGVVTSAVPKEIVGGNHRWTDDGKGMWDPDTDTPVGGIDRLGREINLGSVRYPGGTVANMFDFTKAIGPKSVRGCQTSGGFANGLFAPVDSRYGPDENERFVELADASTMIMVPSINRTAADAADYVEYMNAPYDGSNPNGGTDWAAVRAANGHAEPYGISVWEFGNEPYLPNQRYWRSPDVATKVAQFIEGGWQRQTADSTPYVDNDGLFSGCDLATRQNATGRPNQSFRTRYQPIALPGDEVGAAGVGDGPIAEPVLTVGGETWTRVDDLDRAGPRQKVYEIEQASGTVRFGNGRHGMAPPAGARLAIEYTAGIMEGFLAYYDAMKAVDPDITICAGWGKPEFIEAMGSRAYDCLGVHSYSTPAADGHPIRYPNLQVAGGYRTDDLERYRQQMAGYFPDPATRPGLIITEFGTLNTPVFNLGGRWGFALYDAELIAGQIENDVRISILSNLTGLGPANESQRTYGGVFGSSPDFLITATSRMQQHYSSMVGGLPVASEIAQNPVLQADMGPYPALRTVATCKDGVAQVMVINRDENADHQARVDLVDAAAGARSVTMTTLAAPSVTDTNTNAAPDTVARTVTTTTTTGPSLTRTFGKHSMTLLEFSGGACVAG